MLKPLQARLLKPLQARLLLKPLSRERGIFLCGSYRTNTPSRSRRTRVYK
jgi:hypothetical protein